MMPRTGTGSPPPSRSDRCRLPSVRPGEWGRRGQPGSRRGCGDGGSPPGAPAWSGSPCSRPRPPQASPRPQSHGPFQRWRSAPTPARPAPRPARPRPSCRRWRSAPSACPSPPRLEGRSHSGEPVAPCLWCRGMVQLYLLCYIMIYTVIHPNGRPLPLAVVTYYPSENQ